MDGEHPLQVLGRVEGKVDLILDHLHATDERLSKAEGRIGAVERKVWYAAGASAVLAGLAVKIGLPSLFGILPH